MVSEGSIDFLRGREARYLVGIPKGQLRKFEADAFDESNWSEVRPGVDVKLVTAKRTNCMSSTVAPIGRRKKRRC